MSNRADIDVEVRPFRSDAHEAGLDFHEVVVSGDGGDISWGAWADPAAAAQEAARLNELLDIVIWPRADGQAAVRGRPGQAPSPLRALPDPPAMTFDPATLLDPERMRNGPLVVYWQQDGEIDAPPDLPLAPRPAVKGRYRLMRCRPFGLTMRLAPPPGRVSLEEFGNDICDRLGIERHRLDDPANKAVWLTGSTVARQAPGGLVAAGRLLTQLEGIYISACQVRVDPFPYPDPGPSHHGPPDPEAWPTRAERAAVHKSL